MIKFENNFYKFIEENNKLKFYSDEFDRLLSNYGIKLNKIELELETGDIYCYIEKLNYKKINCSKLDKILKENVPYIQDILLNDDFFVLLFNVDIVELF